MNERPCIRGCVLRGEHFAACPDFGLAESAEQARAAGVAGVPRCRGCVPRPARRGALICNGCYGRLRRMLDEAPDVVGRIRSHADPMKATAYDRARSGGTSIEAPAPVAADLIDAADAVMATLQAWSRYLDEGVWSPRPLRPGVDAVDAYQFAYLHAVAVLDGLDDLVNDLELITALCDQVFTRHDPDEHGEREAWSIADVLARYPAERREAGRGYEDEEPADVAVHAVPEWDDKLIPRAEAASLVGRDEKTLRRWVKQDRLHVAATTWMPRRVSWFRTSEVLAAAREASNA